MSVKDRIKVAIKKCVLPSPIPSITTAASTNTHNLNQLYTNVPDLTFVDTNWVTSNDTTTIGSNYANYPQPTMTMKEAVDSWITYTPPLAPQLTDEQIAKIEEKLVMVLSNGWSCPKCQAVWAPTIEFCRVCSFVERLDKAQ